MPGPSLFDVRPPTSDFRLGTSDSELPTSDSGLGLGGGKLQRQKFVASSSVSVSTEWSVRVPSCDLLLTKSYIVRRVAFSGLCRTRPVGLSEVWADQRNTLVVVGVYTARQFAHTNLN